MKRNIALITAFLLCCFSASLSGQNKDKAVFRELKPGFFQNSILKDDRNVNGPV
jgi:hypothetical protein